MPDEREREKEREAEGAVKEECRERKGRRGVRRRGSNGCPDVEGREGGGEGGGEGKKARKKDGQWSLLLFVWGEPKGKVYVISTIFCYFIT
jgi:hypothetical protein